MPFTGYAKLGFIDSDGERHNPGDSVELATDTDAQQKDVDRLRAMGVIVVENPAGVPDDAATFDDER